MASREETRILNIRVNYNDAIKSISEYRENIEQLQDDEKKLKEQLDEGTISREDYNKEMMISKAKIAENRNEIRMLEKAVRNNIKAENSLDGSLKQLRAELSIATQKYDEMSEAMRISEEGQKLRDEINEITKKLKEGEEETGRFYRNVGNYTQSIIEATKAQVPFANEINKSVTAIKGLGDYLGGVGEEVSGIITDFKDATSGLSSMSKAQAAVTIATNATSTAMKLLKVALVSTGIGAIVVAIGSLVAYLTKTQKGVEITQKAMKALGAAIDVIIYRASLLGDALVKVFTGDFKGAADSAKNAFKGITTEIKEETQAAWALSDALNQLDKDEIMLSMRRAANKADIERLKLIADDTTKSIEERTAAIKKAFDMEQADMEAQKKAAELRLANMLGYTKITSEATELINKIKEGAITADEVINSLGLSNSTIEDLRTFEEQFNRVQEIVQSSTTRQIEQQNKLNSLMKEAIELADKQRTAAERYEFASRALTEINGIVLKQQEDLNISTEGLIKLAEQNIEQKKQEAQEEIDIEQKKAEAKIMLNSAVSESIQAMGELGEDFKALSKVLALAQIAFSTGEAIAKMTAAEAGKGIFGLAPMAAGIAQILANIAAAKKAISGYATGGLVTGAGSETSDSITARLSNGESVMTARATSMFAPLLSSLNQMGGGVPIQMVGTSSSIGEDMLAAAVAKGMIMAPAPVVSVEEIQRVQKRVNVLEELGSIG